MHDLKPMDYVRYVVISFPYELVKIHITVMAHARHAFGLNKWVVTKRNTRDPKAKIASKSMDLVTDPDKLVEDSPYAPSIRRLFSGTFDQTVAKSIQHSSTLAGSDSCGSSLESGSNDSPKYQSSTKSVCYHNAQGKSLSDSLSYPGLQIVP